MQNLYKRISDENAESLRRARKTKIRIRKEPLDKMIREAFEKYNAQHQEAIESGEVARLNASTSVTQMNTLMRSIVSAHIRHEYSNYDEAWQSVHGMDVAQEAHDIIKRTALAATEKIYPELFRTIPVPALASPEASTPLLSVRPALTARERESILAALTADELHTFTDALSKEIHFTVEPADDLILRTGMALRKQVNMDAKALWEQQRKNPRFLTELVREAVRNQSDFEQIALTYEDRPGFGTAWHVLYRTLMTEFALHYPTLSYAFQRAPIRADRDWQNRVTSVTWTSTNGSIQTAQLSIKNTTYLRMFDAGKPRLIRGGSQADFLASLLDVCLEDCTNFSYEIGFLYRSDVQDPVVNLAIMEQVLSRVVVSYPFLRNAVASRLKELRDVSEAHLREVAAQQLREEARKLREQQEMEAQERETQRLAEQAAIDERKTQEQEKQAQEREMQRRAEQSIAAKKAHAEKKETARMAVIDATAATVVLTTPKVVPPSDYGLLSQDEQKALVRRLASGHSEGAKYQREAAMAPEDQRESILLFGIFQVHLALQKKYPQLSEAIALEVKRREKALTERLRIDRDKKTKQEKKKHPAVVHKELSRQRAEVRQFATNHPSVPTHQKQWGSLPREQRLEARIASMRAVHDDILLEHPHLTDAVAAEAAIQETRIRRNAKPK